VVKALAECDLWNVKVVHAFLMARMRFDLFPRSIAALTNQTENCGEQVLDAACR
jgi:hypothetical protein